MFKKKGITGKAKDVKNFMITGTGKPERLSYCPKCCSMTYTVVDDSFFICGKCKELKRRDE